MPPALYRAMEFTGMPPALDIEPPTIRSPLGNMSRAKASLPRPEPRFDQAPLSGLSLAIRLDDTPPADVKPPPMMKSPFPAAASAETGIAPPDTPAPTPSHRPVGGRYNATL